MDFVNIHSKNANNSKIGCVPNSKTRLSKLKNSIDQMMNEQKNVQSIFIKPNKKTSFCAFKPNNCKNILRDELKIPPIPNKNLPRGRANSDLNVISKTHNLKHQTEIDNINDIENMKNENPDIVLNLFKVKNCSFIKYGIKESSEKIKYAYCKTCDSNLVHPICISCINICHKGHIIKNVSNEGFIKCACAEKKHKVLKNSNTDNIIECLCNEWIITSKLNIYYKNKNGEVICEMCRCYCDVESKDLNNQINLSNINNEVNIPKCTCKNEEIHGDKQKIFEIFLKLINDENNFNSLLHPVQFINMLFKSKQSFNKVFETFIIFDQKLKSSDCEIFLNYLYQFSRIDFNYTNIYKCIHIIEKIIQKISNQYVCFYCEEIRNFFSFNTIKKLIECINKSNNTITEKFGLLLAKEYLFLFRKVYINYNVLLLDKYKINDLKNLSFLQRILIFRENPNLFKESDDIINYLIKCLKNANIKGFSCIESLDYIKEIYSILRKLSNFYLISNRNMIRISIEILNIFNWIKILRKLFIIDNQQKKNDIKNFDAYHCFTEIELKLYYTIVKMLFNFIYTYNDQISYKALQNKENIDIMAENIGFIYKKDELGRLISKITIVILTVTQKYYESSNDERNNLVKKFGMEILQYYLNKDDNYMINLLRSINYYKNYSGWEDILSNCSSKFCEIVTQKERISKAYYKYFNFELNKLELYQIMNDSLNIVLGKLTNNIYSINEEELEKGFSFNKNIEIIKTNYFYIILKILDIIYYNNYKNIVNKEKGKTEISNKNSETMFVSNILFKKSKEIKKLYSNDNSSVEMYENQIITKIIYFYFCFTHNSSENSFFIISYYFINELMVLPIKYSKLIFKLFYTCINNIAKSDNNIIAAETHIVKKLYNYLEILMNEKTNDDSLLMCIHYFLRILQIIAFNLGTSYFNILLNNIQLILLSFNNTYNLVSKFFEMKDSEHIITIEESPSDTPVELSIDNNNDESIKDLLSKKGNSTIAKPKSKNGMKFSVIKNLNKNNEKFRSHIQVSKNKNINITNINDLSSLSNSNFLNNKNKIETLNKCFVIYITLINDCFDFSMNDDRKKIDQIIKIDKIIFALKNYKLNLDLRTEFLRFLRKMIIDVQYSTNDNDLYSKAIIDNNDNLSYIKTNPLISNLKYPTKLLSFAKDFYNISAKRTIREKIKDFEKHIDNDIPIIKVNFDNNKMMKLSELNATNKESILKMSQLHSDINESVLTHHHNKEARFIVGHQRNKKIKGKKLNLNFKQSINDSLQEKNSKYESDWSKFDDNNESEKNDSCENKFYTREKNSYKKKEEKEDEKEKKKINENEENKVEEKEGKILENHKEKDVENKKQKIYKYLQTYNKKKSASSPKLLFNNYINNYNVNNSNVSCFSESKKSEIKQKKEIEKDDDDDDATVKISDIFNSTLERYGELGSNKINSNIDSLVNSNLNNCGYEKNNESPKNNNINKTTTIKSILKKSDNKSNNEKNSSNINEKDKKKVSFIVDSKQESLIHERTPKRNISRILKNKSTIENNSEKPEKNTTNIFKNKKNAINSIDESNVYNLHHDQLNKTVIKTNLIESFDEEFYEVLQYELENLIINTQDIELNNPEGNDKLRNFFENGLLIPIIYYFKKIFAFIQDFTGNSLIKLYTLVEECISLKLYISGFKFDFWREELEDPNIIYKDSQKNLNDIYNNKISINLQNYGKTNKIKEPIIDGSCFIDSHLMGLTYESLDYIKSRKTSIFDYTALYQIIDQEFFSLIKDRKKTDIEKLFQEENELEITDEHSLKKEFNSYKKNNGGAKDSMEMKLIKIFIIYKFNKQICFSENNSALFSILPEIYYGYEISYRNLLIKLLINNGKNLDFKNEFTDMSYFLLYKLLSLQTNETQIDIIYLLGGQYSSEVGFLRQFSQNLFNRIVLLFIEYLNPPDKIIQSNYFIAFNLVKIFKYLCEGHNNFFQRHLIKSLDYFYVSEIPSFYYSKKMDKLNNVNESQLSLEEKVILDKYFGDNNNKNQFSIKFFDFFLFTLTKLILISNWGKKSFKDENKQTPFFYDLFFSILELLIRIIQGNKAEILSALCENIDDEIKNIFGDNFKLPDFNNKLNINISHLNIQFSEKRSGAFEIFVKESISLMFKEKNNLELMYKIKNDIMEFFITLLEEKNIDNNMKKIINKHLNINKIFANISYILKSYYLSKNSDFEQVKKQDKNVFNKRQNTHFIIRESQFARRKPVFKLEANDNDKSIIPLAHNSSFLQPIRRPDINEIIKMHSKIYMQKYGIEQEINKINQSKNNFFSNNNDNNILLSNNNSFSNSNYNLFVNNANNNLDIKTEKYNDLPKTENSKNSKILKFEAISKLNHKYANTDNNNRIDQIMKKHKTNNRNFKMIEINRSDTINFMEKMSKITLGKKLFNYFKLEFYDSEIFNKTIEFRLSNIFYRYIKLIDIQQKSVHNNSFIEEIMKINEKILNVEIDQILPSEFDGYDNSGTFELNSEDTLKNNNSPTKKTLDKDYIEKYYIVKFFESITTTVEIRTSESKYQTVIFTNLPEMKYLSEGTKLEFEKNVNRDNETSKKMDLLRYIEYFIKEIKFNKKHHKNFERNFLNKIDFYYLEVLMYIYALLINLFILIAINGDIKISVSGSQKNRRQSRKNIQNSIETSINDWDKIYELLSYIYIFLNLMLISFWLKLKLPLYYKIDKRKYKMQFKIFGNKKLSLCNKLYIIIKMSIINRKSLLLLIYELIICLLSLLIPKGIIIFSFLLLPIIALNSTLKGVLISVQLKYKELILTFFLSAIIMYVFSSLAFFLNNADFSQEMDYYEDNYCKTLVFSFLNAIDNGLRARGGLGDSAKRISFSRNKNHFILRTILDDLFFLLIVIIMIDMVFGIIIQSFVELRNKIQKYESDKCNHCFICHINKNILEKNRLNFDEHIKTAHNLWNYVEYIIGLKFKKKRELSDLDNYVKTKIENKDISCLPTYKKLDKQNFNENIEYYNWQNKLVVPEEKITHYKLRSTSSIGKTNRSNKLVIIEGLNYY